MINNVAPITLIKVKIPNYKPMPADLEKWRDAFMEAQNDPDFKVFTHDVITIETIYPDLSECVSEAHKTRKINLVIEESTDPPENVKRAFESILEAIKCFEQLTCGKCRKCKDKIEIGYNTCIMCARESEP
jgi:hypothetical protein